MTQSPAGLPSRASWRGPAAILAASLVTAPGRGLSATVGAGPHPIARQVTLYVSPSGNDSWSGRLSAPNGTRTDGPFATFDHARAAVRSLDKTSVRRVVVQFRGGTYTLPATLVFTAADSGSPGTEIVYENYPGESPVLTGGVRVTGFTNTAGNVWKASLPSSTRYFENLFYNGVRRLRPRLGSTDGLDPALGAFLRVAETVYLTGPSAPPPPASAPDPNCPVWIDGNGWECFDRFRYALTDPITSTWKNLAPPAGNPCGQPAGDPALAGDVEVLVFEQFSTSKLRVACVDAASRTVYTTGPTGISHATPKQDGFIAGNRYLVENVEDVLGSPGQWFLDRSSTPWTLTVLARPGENPNADLVVVPQIPQVLVASGLQDVTFRGLTFEHDDYVLPAAGHVARELEPDIGAAVSFQNCRRITFDANVVTETSGSGLEFIPCVNGFSPAYCLSADPDASVTDNLIQNGAFYDIGAVAVRIGNPYQQADTDANVPQGTVVENNVVAGYGRVIPSAFGIGQGMGHHNLYTHNDVYDGYHCGVSTSQGIGDTTTPAGIGNAYNVMSFNHVHDLLQGIMNDGGAMRIDGGNQVFTAAGNKILGNRIHDVSDASALDANGYGGHGIYLDDSTGLVDVENNLVYRVSGYPVYAPHGPVAPGKANTIKNNILAYGRQGMIAVNFPYGSGVPSSAAQVYVIRNNLFYFDHDHNSSPKFWVQGGCLYSGGFPYPGYQEWSENMYWRTDGQFASDAKAFAVQPAASTGPNAPCSGNTNNWTFYTFSGWQQTVGEDVQSVIQNPGFTNPTYPADDFSLPHGSPGAGFVVFDPSQAGRSNPQIHPPAVSATFPTKTFNPATDF